LKGLTLFTFPEHSLFTRKVCSHQICEKCGCNDDRCDGGGGPPRPVAVVALAVAGFHAAALGAAVDRVCANSVTGALYGLPI
jgi:hypothetical protein